MSSTQNNDVRYSQGKSFDELAAEQRKAYSPPITEPQILCPNCGCLSLVGAKKCECGYILRRSSAPYIITAVVVALLLILSAWLIASSPRISEQPHEEPVTTTTPMPEPTNTPAVIFDALTEAEATTVYYQGLTYHHSSECPAFDKNTYYYFNDPDSLAERHTHIPCSVCVKFAPAALDEITTLYYLGNTFHASRACPRLNTNGPYTAQLLSDGVNFDYTPCEECIIYNQVAVRHGQFFNAPEAECYAPLSIVAPSNLNCYVSMLFLGDGTQRDPWDTYTAAQKCSMSFYVAAGKELVIDVPLGEYELYYACGSSWYGTDFHFGADTAYYQSENTLRFYYDGYNYQGWTIELISRDGSNIGTKDISPEDFPG